MPEYSFYVIRFTWLRKGENFSKFKRFRSESLREVIARLVSRRAYNESKFTCYTVRGYYADGRPSDLLLRWRADGKKTFGFLIDPEDPDNCFYANPDDVPICIEADDLMKLDELFDNGGIAQ